MEQQVITSEQIIAYNAWLLNEEKGPGTVEKYQRDVGALAAWLNGEAVTKERISAWKDSLLERGLAPVTVNSMLAAVNSFLRFTGWENCRVKFLKIQHRLFRDECRELTRSEYERLIAAAYAQGRERLALLMETICATGIRVSEVRYLTVEAVGHGKAEISLKGKVRTVLIPGKLCRKLLQYARAQKTASGEIFLTRSGRGISRKQIWAEMKAVCRAAGVPLAADTTVVPFPAFRAREFGVDLEIVSSTKYLAAGTGLGGLLVDYGTFDWSLRPKLARAAEVYGVAPREAFTAKLRREVHRNLGAYMTPQAAWQQSLGLETLEVRYARASRTASEVARALDGWPGIAAVNYPGLPSNRFYGVALRQFGEAPGAMLTFDLASQAACYGFLDRLQSICRATNLFDNKSLAIHPWSTIFGTFSEQVRREMDISPCTIRLSVGLEDAEDLLADIRRALE